MSHQDVRRGVTNAKFNEEQSGVLLSEIAIISILAGWLSASWWTLGFVFFGFLIALAIPWVAIPLMLLLSICWGLIGFAIGAFFGSTGASFVLAAFGFLAGLGCHFSALQWVNDIGEK